MSEDPWMEEGGPAFPIRTSEVEAYKGMSLRDYFAGRALAGLLAFGKDDAGKGFQNMQDVLKHYADLSYAYADAMLAARLPPSPEKDET